MRGFVMVVDHPYYAVTDEKGNYTLSDVPPGTYKVKVWRDNWQLAQPKDAEGRVTGYQWGKDFEKEQQVTVIAGKPTDSNFILSQP